MYNSTSIRVSSYDTTINSINSADTIGSIKKRFMCSFVVLVLLMYVAFHFSYYVVPALFYPGDLLDLYS